MADSTVKKRSPGNLVFQNPYLVQDILERASINLMDNLELRRINKVFNEEFLRNFRKTHRNMEIVDVYEKFDDKDSRRIHKVQRSKHTVKINDNKMIVSECPKYFKFLLETMGVRLEKLEVLGFMITRFQGNGFRLVTSKMHDFIVNQVLRNQSLKSLVGMYDVCESGCVECRRRGFGCEEYGPLQLTDLTATLEGKLHFRNLIVTDRLLTTIALQSTNACESKAECLAVMRSMISANITCDRLTFHMIAMFDGLPREIIDEMCRVWEPKTIRIHFKSFQLEDGNTPDVWNPRAHFTVVQFVNPIHETSRGWRRFDELEIVYDNEEIPELSMMSPEEEEVCLVASARRVFPTSRLLVQLAVDNERDLDQEAIDCIINAVLMDNFEDLHVTFRWTPRSRGSYDFEVPQSFDFMGKHVTATLLPSTIHSTNRLYDYYRQRISHDRLTGRTFRMADRQSKCVIDMEVMIRNSDIERVLEKEEGNVSKGYIQHYVPKFCELSELKTLWNGLTEHRHYGRIDVAQKLLNDIASFCVYGAVSREHCMTMMRCLITPRITCDTLCLKVNEFLYINWGVKYPIEPLPREVVEEMCRVWRVQSVIVRFDYFPPQHTLPETWSARRWFTEFRLNAPSGRQPETVGLRFGRVRIDVRKTAVACFEVLSDYSVTANAQCAHIPDTPHYNNLVANARKLFPTDRILVDGSEEVGKYAFGQFNELLLCNILSTALKEYDGQEGLEVTLRHFPNVSPTADTSYEPPDSFEYEGRHFFTNTTVWNYSKKTFLIREKSANFRLILELVTGKSR